MTHETQTDEYSYPEGQPAAVLVNDAWVRGTVVRTKKGKHFFIGGSGQENFSTVIPEGSSDIHFFTDEELAAGELDKIPHRLGEQALPKADVDAEFSRLVERLGELPDSTKED